MKCLAMLWYVVVAGDEVLREHSARAGGVLQAEAGRLLASEWTSEVQAATDHGAHVRSEDLPVPR